MLHNLQYFTSQPRNKYIKIFEICVQTFLQKNSSIDRSAQPMDVLGKNEVKDKMKKTRKHKSSQERQILQASTKLYEIKLGKLH